MFTTFILIFATQHLYIGYVHNYIEGKTMCFKTKVKQTKKVCPKHGCNMVLRFLGRYGTELVCPKCREEEHLKVKAEWEKLGIKYP